MPNGTNGFESNGEFNSPPQENFDTDAFRGSLQEVLSDNIGEYVVIEFLIGTQLLQQKQGILYSVGRGFVVLYEEVNRNYVVCDIFSVKFVTFYLPGERPANGRPASTVSAASARPFYR